MIADRQPLASFCKPHGLANFPGGLAGPHNRLPGLVRRFNPVLQLRRIGEPPAVDDAQRVGRARAVDPETDRGVFGEKRCDVWSPTQQGRDVERPIVMLRASPFALRAVGDPAQRQIDDGEVELSQRTLGAAVVVSMEAVVSMAHQWRTALAVALTGAVSMAAISIKDATMD